MEHSSDNNYNDLWPRQHLSKTRCGGGFLENGGKISVFKQKRIPVDGAFGVKISLVIIIIIIIII